MLELLREVFYWYDLNRGFLIVSSLLSNSVLTFSSSAVHFFAYIFGSLKYISIAHKLLFQKDQFQIVNISSVNMNFLESSNLFTAFSSNCVCFFSFYVSILLLPFYCERLSHNTVFQGASTVMKADDFKQTLYHIQYSYLTFSTVLKITLLLLIVIC